MALTRRYVKQPIGANLPQYTDAELRKIELALANQDAILATLLELNVTTEIGTFTPQIKGATTAGAGTYTVQQGRYWKRDRLVLVQYRVTTTAHTGTGAPRIFNLPFMPINDNNGFFSGGIFSSTHTLSVALLSPVSGEIEVYNNNTPGAGIVIANAMDFLGSILFISKE